MQNTQQEAIVAVSKVTNEEHLETKKTTTTATATSIHSQQQPDVELAITANEPQEISVTTAATTVEEIPSKVKTRSRFSAAFRSLSKSKKDKDKEKDKDKRSKESSSLPLKSSRDTLERTPPYVLSSGGEDNAADTAAVAAADAAPAKKKSKLSRHFLLGSLKRSKVSPKRQKSNDDDDSLSTITLSQYTKDTSEFSISETPTTSSAPATGIHIGESVRTVQITISGRKVEPTGSGSSSEQAAATVQQSRKTPPTQITTATAATAASASTETDYLTPLTTPTTTEAASKTTTTTTTTTTTKDKRITSKVIVGQLGATKDISQNSHSNNNNNNNNNNSSSKSATTSSFAKVAALAAKKKKLKPKKSSSTAAAAKPTPTPTTAVPAGEEKFVITESVRDTPPRERAPAKPSRLSATSSQTPQTLSSTGAVRKSTTRATATLTSPSLSKQQPSNAASSKKSLRAVATAATVTVSGRKDKELMPSADNSQQRGHRLTRPTSTAQTQTRATTSTTTKITEKSSKLIKKPQQLHTLPPTPPDDEQSLPSTASQNDEQLLQPPTYPPPPIPANVTPATRSPAHQPLYSTTLYDEANAGDSLRLRHITYESVETVPLSDVDEVVSSAESAARSATPTTSLHFAVGSAVRPLPTANAYEHALAAATASAQDLSTSSDTQSESSRRRLQYAEKSPSLDIDDHDSIKGRRETLHYQSVASEYSYESEEYESSEKPPPMPAFGDLTMDHEMEPTIMTGTGEKREHLYKILVIGELGTGKTSFIKRYVHQFFSQNYRATIGVDFALKVLHWDANTIVRLQLWDIAGQERFGNMTRVYYKEAVGAFIVFDVTRSGTFDCVSKWKEDLDSKVQLPDGSPIPCILLANKCDQEKQGIVTTPDKMDEYVNENGFAGWFETSAKENINIDEAARALVNKILLNDKLITAADLVDSDKFNLNNSGNATETETKSKCAC